VTSPLSRLTDVFVAPADAERPARDEPVDASPSALRRLAGAFVEGAAARQGDAPAAVRTADAIAVLARPADAAAAGGAVALAVARGCVVVLLWGAEAPPVLAPATPGARRLAARLADRGHDVAATGRLVAVALRDGIDEGIRAAAAGAVPAVLVVAGPRDERVDAVLRGQDRVLAVGEGAVAELAARSVARLGVPAETLELPTAPAARALAASGVALVAPLRARVEEALR
jgi:hypothetical protein